MKLLLGSNSPRRNELLSQMGFSFTKVSVDCDESFSSSMEVNEVAEFLAISKSNAYLGLKQNELLLTADTVVIQNGHILNKPANREEAMTMLALLSGKTHVVQTGICLRNTEGTSSESCTTKVTVDELSMEEINYYVDSYKPFDKAGAYGIQEWFGLTQIKSIEGCYFNVVGLPCNTLYKRLRNDYGL